MAIYQDGTMDVIKDGRLERRKCITTERLPFINRTRETQSMQPEIFEGEDVAYFSGIPHIIPHIIPVQWPEPSRVGTLAERLKWSALQERAAMGL